MSNKELGYRPVPWHCTLEMDPAGLPVDDTPNDGAPCNSKYMGGYGCTQPQGHIPDGSTCRAGIGDVIVAEWYAPSATSPVVWADPSVGVRAEGDNESYGVFWPDKIGEAFSGGFTTADEAVSFANRVADSMRMQRNAVLREAFMINEEYNHRKAAQMRIRVTVEQVTPAGWAWLLENLPQETSFVKGDVRVCVEFANLDDSRHLHREVTVGQFVTAVSKLSSMLRTAEAALTPDALPDDVPDMRE